MWLMAWPPHSLGQLRPIHPFAASFLEKALLW